MGIIPKESQAENKLQKRTQNVLHLLRQLLIAKGELQMRTRRLETKPTFMRGELVE